jgi:hypothetical protein
MQPSGSISDRIAGFIISRRLIIIIICLLSGAGFGILIPFSETDPEIRNYVPSSMQSRIETDKIENEFGIQDMVIILFTDSCILKSGNLELIRNIDRALSRMSGISSRTSPFTARSIISEEGSMVAERLIRDIPSDSAGIRKLRESISGNRFAEGIVFSSDMTSASITAFIDDAIPETVTLARIDSLIMSNRGMATVRTGGLPYIRKFIMEDVRKDALVLVPLALIIMLVMLKLTLGRWRSVLMPFSVVVLSVMISMGMLPLLGWKMSIMTLLVPVIMIAVANNYGIYLTARHQEIVKAKPDLSAREILLGLYGSLNKPILFSGLTTIAGIMGLLSHSIIPAKHVGVLAAAGVAVALAMSLFLIPAMISLFGTGAGSSAGKVEKNGFMDGMLNRLARLVVNYPGRILVISVIVTLLLSSGIFLIRIDTNQENYFPARHPVKLASELINRKFGGSQTISVMITGDILDPEVMNGIDRITNKIENTEGVGRVFSISLAVREMSKAIYYEDEEGYNIIPHSRAAIAQMFELYNMSGDPDDFKQLINPDNSRAHILIKLSHADNKTIRLVKEEIDSLSESVPASIITGGYAIIMDDFAGSVMRGQASSLVMALLTVFILLSVIFRSLKGGLTASIPLAASLVIVFGFMGLTGIALDAATALLSSIMIGVGVDFTIQYIWCFKTLYKKGLGYNETTKEAIKTIGRSIIINAISVMAGFSALMFSGFTSIRFFGYLVFISIGACLIGAILIIPAFIIKFKPSFIENTIESAQKSFMPPGHQGTKFHKE